MTRLRLDNVGVRIQDADIVENITIDCASGSFIGVVGPNGSGKSTVLKTIYRAVTAHTGAVLLDDANLIRDLTARQAARKVAALAQEQTHGFDLTVLEVVSAGRTPHKDAWSPLDRVDHDIISAVLNTVGMTAHAGRLFTALSGGEKQRVLLARALVQQPEVLILDEPTNHLDISTQLTLLHLVRSLGITVLAALHDLNLAAAFCDEVHVIHNGSIVGSGTPHDVFSTELIADVFGVQASRGIHPVTGALHLAFAILHTDHSLVSTMEGNT